MADVTIDQLRKMTAYEIELGKELDNEYNNPAPPMPEPVHGENNSQSIFISNEGYSTGRTIEQTDFQNPSATTTTTIRQTTTTTTSSTTLHNQTTSSTTTTSTTTTSTTTLTTTTSTSTTTTTTTTVATTTTSTTTTTSSTSTSTSTTTTTTTTVTTTTTTSSTTTSTTTEATTTTSSTTSTTTTTTSTSTTTTTTLGAIVAQFNFAASGANFGTPTGWIPVYGNPNAARIQVTDTGQNGAGNTGIGIDSVDTATALWNPAGGSCANNTIGPSVANPTFAFPSAVIRSVWYTNLALYITGNENLLITGLVPGDSYKIEMLGGRDGAAIPAANSYCTYVCIDNNGTERVDNYDIKNNTANLQVFNNKVSLPDGTIKLAVFRKSDAPDGGMVIGYINGIRVTKL